MESSEYKEYGDLTEKERKAIDIAEKKEELTQEEIEIVNNLAVEGKILDVSLIEKIRFITQRKFEKMEEHLKFNFGKTISINLEENGDITLMLDNKVLTTLDEESAKIVISNGISNSNFVHVTGILRKTVWEVTNGVKKRIIAAILVALLIIPIPFLLKNCSNQKDPDPLTKDKIESLEKFEINILLLNNYFMKELDDLPMILRMIEDQHEAYQYDLNVLDPNYKIEYEKINKEVEEAAQFLKEVEALKAKYSSKSSLTKAEMDSYIKELKQILGKYYSILNLAKEYAQRHLESTNKRVTEQKQNKVNLNSEGEITSGQIDYITSKMKNVENILNSDLNEFVKLIQERKVIISSDGERIYCFEEETKECFVYDNIANFLEDYEAKKSAKGVRGK